MWGKRKCKSRLFEKIFAFMNGSRDRCGLTTFTWGEKRKNKNTTQKEKTTKTCTSNRKFYISSSKRSHRTLAHFSGKKLQGDLLSITPVDNKCCFDKTEINLQANIVHLMKSRRYTERWNAYVAVQNTRSSFREAAFVRPPWRNFSMCGYCFWWNSS